MNEFNDEEMQGGAEGIELPDVDIDDGGGEVAEGGGGGRAGGSAVFAVVIVLMLAFQAVASHFIVKKLFFSKPPAPKVTEQAAAPDKEIGIVHQVSGLIVNPADSRGSKHLLLNIGLESKDQKVIDELVELEPQIRDNLNTFFSAQRYEVLQDIQYRDKLRQRVQEIVNYYLTKGKVDKVFFIQYVLQ